MRIFVAGATGAVGRPLVSALITAGHSVVGLTRTAAKADTIRRMGAEPSSPTASMRRRCASGHCRQTGRHHPRNDRSRRRHRSQAFRSRLRKQQPVADAWNRLSARGRARGRRQALHRPELLRLGLRAHRRSVKTETDELDPDPPEELRRTLRRSGIWSRPSPARRSPKASFCAMAHSMDRVPECSITP